MNSKSMGQLAPLVGEQCVIEVRVDFDRHGIYEAALPFGRPFNGLVIVEPNAEKREAIRQFAASQGAVLVKPYTQRERHVPAERSEAAPSPVVQQQREILRRARLAEHQEGSPNG
jgi:hypothetical protein